MRHLLLILTLTLSACHESGEWVDDPRNVTRAWGSGAVQDLHPVHSYYWRSWHFTREEVLYFQFAANPKIRAAFIDANHLLPKDAPAVLSSGLGPNRPAWFAPKAPGSYVAWAPPHTSSLKPPNVVLLEDRETGSLFFYGCQI